VVFESYTTVTVAHFHHQTAHHHHTMAEQLLNQVRDLFEGQIDFEGQRLAELITTALLSTVGVIAFFLGFITQDITLTLWVGLAGTALTFLVVVPPWPFFNKYPEQWLPPRGAVSTAGISIDVDGQKVG